MMERLTRFIGGSSFHRGLALGALVGAAIAGSTLWTRLRDAQRTARGGDPSTVSAGPEPPKPVREGSGSPP
jgi:hypothetical protein